MKILLDASVLVAAMVEAHPAHERALPWLKRAIDGNAEGLVAAHSLAEVYAILTTLPVQPKISALNARKLITQNIVEKLEVVFLSDTDYAEVIGHLASLGIIGGVTYDALILRSAIKADVDQVVTFNEKDFRRVYPELADKIVMP